MPDGCGQGHANKKDPYVSGCDTQFLITSKGSRSRKLMEQSDEAIVNEESPKNSTAQCHVLQPCENKSPVVFEFVSELKRLSARPGNGSNKKLFFLIFLLSNLCEPI